MTAGNRDFADLFSRLAAHGRLKQAAIGRSTILQQGNAESLPWS
jgi:hypothetical protein